MRLVYTNINLFTTKEFYANKGLRERYLILCLPSASTGLY